jgi:hypothetical protein
MKIKYNSKNLLIVLLITYIIFDIKSPEFIRQFLHSFFGKLLVFILAIALFSQGPLVGSLALVAAYTLLVRSSSIIQLNTDEFIPDQRKKEKFFRKTLNNHFPKTLEEEMVKHMIPLVRQAPIIESKYVPTGASTYDAEQI